MSLLTVATLSGYLLEETLCQLLRENGYRLLQSESDDPDALRDSSRGLLVRGRGAEHQADALGDLLLPSPFSLPIRLFVEAKNRGSKATLRDVRNAHGVVTDVNEHYSTSAALAYQQPLRRYLYRYALFSTSGFTADAQGFALAHQISLIDLSGPAFKHLVDLVTDAAVRLHAEAVAAGLASFPITRVRRRLRAALGRVEEVAPRDVTELAQQVAPRLRNIRGRRRFDAFVESWSGRFAAALNDSLSGEGLIIGFPPAPFILAMRPDSIVELEDYVAHYGPDINVRIAFDREAGVAGDWTITPADASDGFRLSFGLPGALETWLLAGPDGGVRRAAEAKRGLLSTITMFLEDQMVSLRFTPASAPPVTPDSGVAEATDATDDSWLRRELQAPPSVKRAEQPGWPATANDIQMPPAHSGEGWSDEAVEKLMRRLDAGHYVQAALIREAARRGGVISRATVYDVANFARNRTLRGLTRPPRRFTAALISNGDLPEDAAYPFLARYENGVRASHFEVPHDVVAALRRLEEGRGT